MPEKRPAITYANTTREHRIIHNIESIVIFNLYYPLAPGLAYVYGCATFWESYFKIGDYLFELGVCVRHGN